LPDPSIPSAREFCGKCEDKGRFGGHDCDACGGTGFDASIADDDARPVADWIGLAAARAPTQVHS
jgi:hypothetical protein